MCLFYLYKCSVAACLFHIFLSILFCFPPFVLYRWWGGNGRELFLLEGNFLQPRDTKKCSDRCFTLSERKCDCCGAETLRKAGDCWLWKLVSCSSGSGWSGAAVLHLWTAVGEPRIEGHRWVGSVTSHKAIDLGLDLGRFLQNQRR